LPPWAGSKGGGRREVAHRRERRTILSIATGQKSHPAWSPQLPPAT
jgi:hypothetical protein